jgi:hypothetical protein
VLNAQKKGRRSPPTLVGASTAANSCNETFPDVLVGTVANNRD